MKKASKITAALLAVIMILGVLFACSTPGDKPQGSGTVKPGPAVSGDETTNGGTPSDEKYVLPNEDLGGTEIKIFSIMGPVTTWLTFPFFTTEDSSTKISAAVYNRNALIEERLKCQITEDNANNTNGELWNTLLAGDEDEYQVGVDYSWASLSRATENYLVDFENITPVHLDKPWWDSNLNEAFSLNGHVFITSGSAMVSSWDEIFVTYFNSKVAADMNLNLYEEVKNGGWTFERMMQIIPLADTAIDDPGAENDHYGFATQAFYAVPSFMGTNNVTYAVKNSSGKLENFSTSEKFINTVIRISENLKKSDAIYYGDAEIDQMFMNGETFFLHNCIGVMTNMRDFEDYGVLPMPKWDEEGGYHSYSGAQYLLFVPYTNKILEKTGIVLEAMMGISEYTLKDVYIEEMLGQIYSRTPEASEMLYDYILPNTLYDMGGRQGLSFNNLIPLVQAVPLGMTDIKSLVDPVADTIQLTIDNIYDFNG